MEHDPDDLTTLPDADGSGLGPGPDGARRLGSFRLVDRLGAGSMGEVFKAVYEPDSRVFALKTIVNEGLRQGKSLERFEREIKILKNLRHPNIVRFITHGRFKGTDYLVMEFIEGQPLDKVIEKRETLPWKTVAELGSQLCGALHHAHELHVIHRDLKPSNVMVSAQGKVKLTDFGIAKALDDTALTATGRTVGTAPYMAPEQITDTSLVSHKTDLYALGCMLYHLLVGRPPFVGPNTLSIMHAHLNEEPPDASDHAEVPPKLDELIKQLLAKDPAKRPWDAAAVRMRLEEIRDSNWVPEIRNPKPIQPFKSGKPKRKAKEDEKAAFFTRERVGTLALVGLLLLVVGLIFGYIRWKDSTPRHAAEAHYWIDRKDYDRAEDHLRTLLARPDDPDREWTKREFDAALKERAKRRVGRIEANPKFANGEAPESLIVTTLEEVKQAREHKSLQEEAAAWGKLAKALNREDERELGFALLAEERSAEAAGKLNALRERVASDLIKVANLRIELKTRDEAKVVLQRLIADLRACTDLDGERAEVEKVLEGLEGRSSPEPSSKE